MSFSWLAVPVFLLSWFLTQRSLKYALSRHILDIPNARSSHAIPTPRGGGVGFVLAFISAVVLLYLFGTAQTSLVISLAGGCGVVALIGFADDHASIPARWRLLAHFLGAGFGLYWLNGLPSFTLAGFVVEPQLLSWLLGLTSLVWLLNLYNFMDGIDGLAAIEAICCCVAMCLIYGLFGFEHLIAVPLLLAAAVTGFLILNFPPARIFMGDVGSGFLGLCLGLLAINAGWHKPALMFCWAIMLGVFIVDATLTLVRRFIRGERVYQAHRSHAYQHAANRYGHKRVTISVACINFLFLLPISMLVATEYLSVITGLSLAFIPLGVLAFYFGAGTRHGPI